jgi:hypothetical protein
MTSPNRYLQAFKESYNLVGLAGAVALAAATLNPLVLLPALVLEAAYLIFVPDMRWYMQRLARLNDAEIEARRKETKDKVLPTLRPDLQQRFLRLEELRRQIGTISLEEQTWFLEVLRKLDYLLDKFLQFSSKEVQFRGYLNSLLMEARGVVNTPPKGPTKTSPPLVARSSWLDDVFDSPSAKSTKRNGNNAAAKRAPQAPQTSTPRSVTAPDRWVNETVAEIQGYYDDDLNDLRALAQNEKDDGTRAVLQKRVEVLERRREFVGKMGRILVNLNHQLELLEDTFGLISDEIRARPPEQVLADIEDVVTQTNTMTQVLEEMAPYEQSLARLMN